MTKSETTQGSTVADGSTSEPTVDQPIATFDREEPRFALAEELGRGGMGRVVAAVDVALARSVAIKQVLSVRPEDVARFEREVRITAQLEHPSIVPIHEAARDANGRPYYVMRRIDGDPLSKRLEGANVRARLAMLPNLLAVVDAAAFAHARKIIHRDIKPSNILLGNYGETHLIDWGLARRVDDVEVSNVPVSGEHELTRAGHIYGTIAYMSPEQARGEKVDQRADVYALGATLFHVLAGRAPFAGLSDAERIAAAEAAEDRIPLDAISDEVPHELVAIVDKATARDPDARYQHAGELAADLRAFLAGKLVAAHRYTVWQRFRLVIRRHRVAFAIASVALAALAVVSAIAIVRVIRETAEATAARRLAEVERGRAEDRHTVALLDRADAMTSSDPTQALTLLRHIPIDSPHAERARNIAAAAASKGIFRGASVHTKRTTSLAFSPDHESLASTGDDGLVVVYEVATGGHRTVATLEEGGNGVAWLGAGTLVVVTGHTGIRVIDVASRRMSWLVHGSIEDWCVVGNRVRYHDREHELLVEAAVDGDHQTVAEHVVRARCRDGVSVFERSDGQTGILDRQGTRVAAVPSASKFVLDLSVRRGIGVVGSRERTYAFELATGKQLGAWETGFTTAIGFANQFLIAFATREYAIDLLADGHTLTRSVRGMVASSVEIASGSAFLSDRGSLYVVDDAATHALHYDLPQSRTLAGTPDGMLVAIGSVSGTVRWIDLSQVTPPPLAIPPIVYACAATSDRMYLLGLDELQEVDVATRRTKLLATMDGMGVGIHCSIPINHKMMLSDPTSLWLLDFERKTFDKLPDHSAVFQDSERRMLWTVERDVYEITATSPAHMIWRAPAPILQLYTYGAHQAFVLEGNQLLRRDLTTGAIEIRGNEAPPSDLGMFDDGTWWVTRGNTFYRWGDDLQPIATFSDAILVTRVFGDRVSIVLQDGSVWSIEPDRQILKLANPTLTTTSATADDLVASPADTGITLRWLRTNTVSVFNSPDTLGTTLSLDGKLAVFKFPSHLIAHRDLVPPTFAETRAWIDRVTNAVQVRETDPVTWK